MPGEDENKAALECAAVAKIAELHGEPVAVVQQKLDAMAELLRQEAAEDKEKARRRGLNMDTSTIDFDALAREQLTREQRVVKGWKHPLPPPGWSLARGTTPMPDDVNVFYQHRGMRLAAGLSCEIENDGRAWLHLSVSHRDRIPNWNELSKAKQDFLGDIEAYQVMPPKARYVNIDPRVLNLYAPLNGPVLPDFTRGTGGI